MPDPRPRDLTESAPTPASVVLDIPAQSEEPSPPVAPGEATVVLDIPAKPEYVAIVRHVLSIIAGREGLISQARADDLVLAVSEACSNAIASYGDAGTDRGARVVVRTTEEADRLVVEIDDTGGGFDPSAVDPSSIHTDAHPASRHRPIRAERGRGVSLMHALVDDVEIVSSPSGTSVTVAIAYDRDEVSLRQAGS